MTRVLVVASDPVLGTDFYRATGPFSRLPVELVKPDGGQFSWSTLAGVDVCFIQRPATPHEIRMIETAKNFNVPVCLDLDDDPFSLTKSNPVYEIWNQDDKQECVREALRLADITLVSTDHLKHALLEQVPTADIRVVPNAQDDKLFSFVPYGGERNKIIAMRGGASHGEDWEIYKDGILEILEKYPDYKLAVLGYHPEWMRAIPDSQLRLYEFSDIPTYFSDLMLLRPQVAIVPLANNKFNYSKSSIGWQEFTMAGATVIASPLPEFMQPGVILSTPTDLLTKFELALKHPDLFYEQSLNAVPRLSRVNEKRLDILEELKSRKTLYTPCIKQKETLTPEQFHNHTLSHGWTSDDHHYKNAHSELAEWLINTLNPKTALELGCGSGGTLVELLKRGVMAYGIELNPRSVQYFKDRNPMYENQIFEGDITTEPIDSDTTGDLVYSLEVFEHISKPDEWWVNLLNSLSKKFKYFYFSSTPYYKNEHWDEKWGHINIKKTSSWKALFEQAGWKFVSNPKILVNWDLLFETSLAR